MDSIVSGELESKGNQAALAELVDRVSGIPTTDDVDSAVEVDNAMRGERYH